MMKRVLFLIVGLLACQLVWAQSNLGGLKGKITQEDGQPLPSANIVLKGKRLGTSSDVTGDFTLQNIPAGKYEVVASMVGFEAQVQEVTIKAGEITNANFTLKANSEMLSEVEVFGVPDKQPDKLDAMTRLPLQPRDQIQSISVISNRLIELQGNLTISDATKNVPGVYTFATYGNRRESMSARGFRGIPILKNGVRVHSDFRGVGILTDMSGVESMQVMKGSAAITQGIAGDLGSPGGVINIVTKTPKFRQGGNVSLRVGSWGQVRPTFDVYGPMDKKKTVAFRINGAYERSDSYRAFVSNEKIYVNPSLAWRPDSKTTITLEMDYLDDNRTPDPGTVNLAENDKNAIYDMPHSQFLGYKSDKAITKNATYAARFERRLNSQLSLKAAYYMSNLLLEDMSASLSQGGRGMDMLKSKSQRYRSLSNSYRKDNNSVLQVDLIGQEVESGFLKHTFQVGFDYRTLDLETRSASSLIDTIDVLQPVNHTLPQGNSVEDGDPITSSSKSFGLVAQDVITIVEQLKVFGGIRYSSTQTQRSDNSGVDHSSAWNPHVGVMIYPVKNLNIFGSYTNSSNPRNATLQGKDGEELGNERWDQFEAGIKSSWLKDRLRFNLTLYKINNKNMNMPVYDDNWVETGYYQKGGNDERKGVEVEITGRLLDNLEVIAGYAYTDAKYKEHEAYYYNSAPLNTPKHTANAWANYLFDQGPLKGLSLGLGAYYTGERPINDWARVVTHDGIVPGQKPFNVEAYTLVNAQVSYNITPQLNMRVLFNNIFDEIGYNAYRTRYINQTDPRSFAAMVNYRF
ncbi:TonB-dependent receptor [Rapidithrix thailandica]|uniref:TonB-dependent receptor n=1 Tax=Rapidithrix thailandica TaxID=413964 RepID=A0AAW9RQ36_9BACT